MDVFEFVRNVPDNERPTEKPTPPAPQAATVNAGTDEEWNTYWLERDAYYHGIQLKKN